MPEQIASTALQLNDDRTVTIPIKGREPIVLPEPTLGELEQIFNWMIEADTETNQLAIAAAEARPDYVNLSVEAEKNAVRASTRSPYAVRLVAIIAMLTEEDVDPAGLYGWAGQGQTLSQMFNHWQAPLGGRASQARTLLETLEGLSGLAATNGS